MHLARAGILLRPKLHTSPVSNQLRLASSGNHAREELLDGAHYSPEGGFSTPFWRNALLLSLLAVSFYKWAPPRGDDAYLTRWIAHYSTPRETWARLNEKHMLQSQQVTDNVAVQGRATRPAIIRHRYPQSLEQASPHLQGVGSVPDMSGVTIRT
ncbi:hypothetical protein EV363DRAFT_1550860 [Boletus edulis]|uniref:Uncharacterized protein n=1 Tax=Boletus edulis BED1 TaxID=1328754 RepID=A0AAD4BL02_BOLED|nr:hypothetical protein EV363DRAFT_1550860 [Boletus edulis]KAF8433111.1 hypothetical protein L210DRAFT_3486473 [Boletus edulis BED1]